MADNENEKNNPKPGAFVKDKGYFMGHFRGAAIYSPTDPNEPSAPMSPASRAMALQLHKMYFGTPTEEAERQAIEEVSRLHPEFDAVAYRAKRAAQKTVAADEMSYKEVIALTEALKKTPGWFIEPKDLLGTENKTEAPPYRSSTPPAKPGRK